MGHLSKEQFAALLDERYRIESNLRNSHIDEVHTLEQGLDFFYFQASHLFILLLTLSVVFQWSIGMKLTWILSVIVAFCYFAVFPNVSTHIFSSRWVQFTHFFS